MKSLLLLWLLPVCVFASGVPADLVARQAIQLPDLQGKDRPAYVELNAPMPGRHPVILVDEKPWDADSNPYPFHLIFSKIPGIGFDEVSHLVGSRLTDTVMPAEGKLSLTYQVGPDDKPPVEISRIEVRTPLQNYSQEVLIESSADGRIWTKAGSGHLVDMSKFVDYRRNVINLEKPAAVRWFRLSFQAPESTSELALTRIVSKFEKNQEVAREVVKDLQKQPFRIDNISFYNIEQVPKPPQLKTYSEPGKWTLTQEGDASVLTVTGLGWRPYVKVWIETTSTNFIRPCEILSSLPESSAVRTCAPLRHVDLGGLQESQLAVATGDVESEADQLRIRLLDHGAEPLKITGVRVEYVARELLFLARPGGVYGLGYFTDFSRRPRAAEMALLRGLPTRFEGDSRFVKGTLGEIVPVTHHPLTRLAMLRRWLPRLALALAVVALGWTLVLASRTVNEVPKEP